MEICRYPMKTKKQTPSGMCPNMTKKAATKRKKPKEYKAPLSVKNYYKGIAYGVDLLRDELLELIEDEETKEMIKLRAKVLKTTSGAKLKELEKQKTKQRIKEWEEKEWLGL